MLRWREVSGRPGERLVEKLNGGISRYLEGSRTIMIGLTTDPILRWREERREGWDEMVVVYSTSNRKYAAAVEKDLADGGWKEFYALWDYEDARAGLPGSYTRYYVYVVLEQKGGGC